MSTRDPSPVLTAVAGRRRAPVAFAAWLAALVAVVTWVLAAGLGPAPRDGRSATVPRPGTASPAPSGLPSARPALSGTMELLDGSPPWGTAWLRSGNGVRALHLSSGESTTTVRTGEWRDRILAPRAGPFLCVCVDATAIDGGERVTIKLKDIAAKTGPLETELLTVEGLIERRASADEQTLPVAISASLSPDGSLLAVGIAARRPPSWERSLVIVHLASREIAQRIALDPVPSDARVDAWAPRVQFSYDGLRAFVSLTVFTAGQLSDERHLMSWIHGQLLGLEPVTGFGTAGATVDGKCLETSPRLVGRDTVFGICHDANWKPRFLRSVDLETGRILELDLVPIVKGVWPMTLVEGRKLFLWDPFSHRVAHVDIPSAKLGAAAAIETPTAALEPLDRLARTLSAWIAPPAMAKIMLEPALALSSDGRRLYVVAMSGDGITDPGRASTIHVLDPGSLALRETWTVEPDVVSIAIAPDGESVIIGMLGDALEGVSLEASVAVLDADTGKARARYHGLGTEWPQLIEPSVLNQ